MDDVKDYPPYLDYPKPRKTTTNADRIRSMGDEELAWELMTWRCEAVAKYHGVESQYPNTQKTILSWLQKPAYDDICYECTGYGDDYYLDGDGELVCACDDCPVNVMSTNDDDYEY